VQLTTVEGDDALGAHSAITFPFFLPKPCISYLPTTPDRLSFV